MNISELIQELESALEFADATGDAFESLKILSQSAEIVLKALKDKDSYKQDSSEVSSE